MPRFKVWNPDDEGEDDALIILAHTPTQAAEDYVSQVFNVGLSDSFELLVADEDGVQYKATVDVDYVPSYDVFVTKAGK